MVHIFDKRSVGYTFRICPVLTCGVVGLVDVDVVAVLPLPRDCGLGAAPRVALQGHVRTLRADFVPAAQAVLNAGRN